MIFFYLPFSRLSLIREDIGHVNVNHPETFGGEQTCEQNHRCNLLRFINFEDINMTKMCLENAFTSFTFEYLH